MRTWIVLVWNGESWDEVWRGSNLRKGLAERKDALTTATKWTQVILAEILPENPL